jgi:DNA polymerase I
MGMTETETRRKKLAIIDGKSVFYRGYYAMPNLSTKDGTPTGGVFGFATMALEVIKRLQPDYVCVAWDKPKTNIRRRLEMYPEYKAGRKPTPPDFKEQIPVLHELLKAFGWPLYELDDYEADDIMGTLAVQAAEQGIDTLLITSDLDMLQLVNEHVKVYALKTGFSNIELYSPTTFEAKYGINVHQFVDYKSLVGDSSDNIPGVAGVGPIAARKLLGDYKTLDGIYENIELISGKTHKQLVEHKDMAYLSHKLAEIWIDAPLKLDLAEVDGSKCKPEEVRDMLQRLEFRTLARQLPDYMHMEGVAAPTTHLPSQVQIGTVSAVGSQAALEEMDLGNIDPLFVHSRAAGKHGRGPQTLIVSANPAKKVYVLDLKKLKPKAVRERLSNVFADEAMPKIGYDLKYTAKVLRDLGIELRGVGHDVEVGAFLINPLRREQSLTELAQADLGYEGSSLEDLSPQELSERAGEIMGIIYALYQGQTKQLQDLPKVAELARTIEWPVIPVLADMEYEGIQLDTAYLAEMNERVADMISDLEQQIYGYADQEFNIGSTHQLADILFGKLNLPKQGIKKGKTGYSTAASELDKLRGIHPVIDLISQWREVTKLKNTYIDTLPRQVDENSRLHTTFSLTVAQTGRLSSNDPNLQNIPVRTDLGREIRTAFVAGPGKMLVSADYSQFELRLAAYLAGDQELIEMFNNGADIHTMTAAQIYGRQPDEITKSQRRDAKVVNFGVMYGMSPHGLAIATGMTVGAAKEFIDKYFELRKPLLDYINGLREKARKDGYVETLFGRRRPTPDVHSTNFVVRQAAERAAINMPIQGTEADLMKMAMLQVQDRLKKEFPTARQLLQIHDSILVEADEKDAEAIAKLLKDTMEGVYDLPVKLTVDTSAGRNWGEL